MNSKIDIGMLVMCLAFCFVLLILSAMILAHTNSGDLFYDLFLGAR
jgi:hypothetical protein